MALFVPKETSQSRRLELVTLTVLGGFNGTQRYIYWSRRRRLSPLYPKQSCMRPWSRVAWSQRTSAQDGFRTKHRRVGGSAPVRAWQTMCKSFCQFKDSITNPTGAGNANTGFPAAWPGGARASRSSGAAVSSLKSFLNPVRNAARL